MNQRVAERVNYAVDFFFFAELKNLLKLEALQFFSHGHEHKEIEGKGFPGRHLFGAVAQSGGQVQNHIL